MDFEYYQNLKREVFVPADNGYVYFLYDNNKLVYVGSTVDVSRRYFQHKLSDKEFDYMEYIEVPLEEMNIVEIAFIVTNRPEYNKNIFGNTLINTIEKLKKPYYTNTKQLIDFLKSVNLKPYAIDKITGDEFYRQKDLEAAWLEKYTEFKRADKYLR